MSTRRTGLKRARRPVSILRAKLIVPRKLMRDGSSELGGGNGSRRQPLLRSRPHSLIADDQRKNFVHGAKVILGKINFDPGMIFCRHCIQRAFERKVSKLARSPRPMDASMNQRIHFLNQQLSAVPAELHDADILAVDLARIEFLAYVYHPAMPQTDFHLFIPHRRHLSIMVSQQQRVFVRIGKQVLQDLRMKQNIGVKNDEAFGHLFASKPKREQAVGLIVTGVLYVLDCGAADLAHLFGSKPDDGDDSIYTLHLKGLNVPLD